MNVYSIPGKVEAVWREDVKALISTWLDYYVTLDDFRQAVLVNGVNHVRANGGIAWITDSTQAHGILSKEIQEFIDNDVFPALAEIGIKYFMTITSQVSAVTRLTVLSYSAKVGPHGITLVETDTLDNAIKWLKANE